MFPLGLLAMANHAPPLDGLQRSAENMFTANMKLDWYFYNEEDRSILEENIEGILKVKRFSVFFFFRFLFVSFSGAQEVHLE